MYRRDLMIRGALAAAGLSALKRGYSMPEPALDAWVSKLPRDTGSSAVPEYRSLSDALAAAPDQAKQPFRIGIDAGRWHEKLVVEKPNIHLIGVGQQRSVLSFDAAAGMPRPDGEPWGTWGCASVIVRAPDFRARNLTIENAFDYVAHLNDPNFQPIGANGLQGVALMLDRGADRCEFEDVAIIGHQDSLFVDAGRSRFRRCHIGGSVDFIFGAGRALFERCEVLSRYRPGKPRQGYIAAPSTLRSEPSGLVFHRCRLLREAKVADASVALGRAWRPTRDFADGRYGDPQIVGSAIYQHCWMDAHIDPVGWDAMSYSARDGSRIMLQPDDARLFEYDSRGPGAHRSLQRRWMTAEQASAYAPHRLFPHWDARSQ